MRKSAADFTKELLIKVVGEDRKYKTFNGRMYVSLGNNKVAYIEMGMPTARKAYGWDSLDINVFDKNHGRVDSITVTFEDVCEGTEFERCSFDYSVSVNGDSWFREEPPEEVFNLIHNEIENYLEIFEEGF